MPEVNSSTQTAQSTLLVVEEDEAVRSFLDVALRMHAFDVLLAANGAEALEIFARHADRIRLVLMDVNMAGLSGPETLTQMQQIKPTIACCFMSGDTSAERWPALRATGAREVFTKPFGSIQVLAQTIHQLIDEPVNNSNV